MESAEPESRVNILLVDDHPENLLALEAVLADLGQNLVRAESGREALRCLLHDDFAVILLDVQLPDIDGYEVATLIRERAKSRYTPIIFLTAFNKSETQVYRGYALGAVDYLFKPFAPEVLHSKVAVFVELYKKTCAVESQLAEMRRLNEELDQRNQAILALHRELTTLGKAESALRGEILEWQQAEESVRQAKDEAVRENQAKNELLSAVSHELRTPLTAILGYGSLLGKEPLTPKQRKYLDALLTAGRHLQELIDEVLDVTRVEVGRLDLAPTSVAVSAAVELVQHMIVPMATERRIQLRVDETVTAAVQVLADGQRLNQVLLNLLSNAVKYNVEAGIVTVACASCANNQVRIQVSDTGPGIPAEKQTRLFLPFDRLGLEHSRIEGTGLGLALSKRLVEAMGGSIGVESSPGQGSTFWVELPAAPAVDSPTELPLSSDILPPPSASVES